MSAHTSHGEDERSQGAAGRAPAADSLPVEVRPGDERGGPVARLLAGLVRGYQLIVSPWFAPTCRYYPSCSAYAITALRTRGAIIGTGLAVWRLLRCNPWSRGGVDPVPSRPQRDRTNHTESESAPRGRTLGGRTSRQAQA